MLVPLKSVDRISITVELINYLAFTVCRPTTTTWNPTETIILTLKVDHYRSCVIATIIIIHLINVHISLDSCIYVVRLSP